MYIMMVIIIIISSCCMWMQSQTIKLNCPKAEQKWISLIGKLNKISRVKGENETQKKNQCFFLLSKAKGRLVKKWNEKNDRHLCWCNLSNILFKSNNPLMRKWWWIDGLLDLSPWCVGQTPSNHRTGIGIEAPNLTPNTETYPTLATFFLNQKKNWTLD